MSKKKITFKVVLTGHYDGILQNRVVEIPSDIEPIQNVHRQVFANDEVFQILFISHSNDGEGVTMHVHGMRRERTPFRYQHQFHGMIGF